MAKEPFRYSGLKDNGHTCRHEGCVETVAVYSGACKAHRSRPEPAQWTAEELDRAAKIIKVRTAEEASLMQQSMPESKTIKDFAEFKLGRKLENSPNSPQFIATEAIALDPTIENLWMPGDMGVKEHRSPTAAQDLKVHGICKDCDNGILIKVPASEKRKYHYARSQRCGKCAEKAEAKVSQDLDTVQDVLNTTIRDSGKILTDLMEDTQVNYLSDKIAFPSLTKYVKAIGDKVIELVNETAEAPTDGNTTTHQAEYEDRDPEPITPRKGRPTCSHSFCGNIAQSPQDDKCQPCDELDKRVAEEDHKAEHLEDYEVSKEVGRVIVTMLACGVFYTNEEKIEAREECRMYFRDEDQAQIDKETEERAYQDRIDSLYVKMTTDIEPAVILSDKTLEAWKKRGGAYGAPEELEEEDSLWMKANPDHTMKAAADRYNTGKLSWSLVDFQSLEPLVEALEYGAVKYTPDNWKKGLPEKQILESLLRHVFSLLSGEEIDEESKVHHMGHVMANAMFYTYQRKTKGNKS